MNKTGIYKESAGNRKQILAVTDNFVSFPCLVNTSDLVLAGTPVKGDISNRRTPFTIASAGETPVGVLLHDVEPNKDASVGNGTVLVFGWVNQNRVEDTVKALYTTEMIASLKAVGVTIMSDI